MAAPYGLIYKKRVRKLIQHGEYLLFRTVRMPKTARMSPPTNIDRNAYGTITTFCQWAKKDSGIATKATAESRTPNIVQIRIFLPDRLNIERNSVPIPIIISG